MSRIFAFLVGSGGGSPAPAPVITSAYPEDDEDYATVGSLQDPAGGTNIVVEGSDFVAGLTLEFRQAGVTIDSIVVLAVDPTDFTTVCPVLPPGMYDLRVVNPDAQNSGASGDGLHESWEPIEAAPRLLCLPGDYSVTGTQGVNASGTWTDSSGNGFHLTSPAGSTYAPAASSGSPVFTPGQLAYLQNITANMGGPVYSATYISRLDGGTVITFAKPDRKAAEAADYTNAALVAGTSATPNLAIAARGFKAVGYQDSSALYEVARSGKGRVGSMQLAAIRWNATTLEAGVNDNAFVSTPLAGAAGLSGANMGYIEVGRSYGGTAAYGGDLSMVAVFDSKVSDAIVRKFLAWGRVMSLLPSTYFVPVGTYHHLTSSAGVTTAIGDTVVASIADQSGTGDSNKNITATATNPLWTPSDPNFAGKPSWGSQGANVAGMWMVSGTFAAPLSGPRTVYHVLRVSSLYTTTLYARFGADGLANGIDLYGAGGGMVVGTPGGTFSLSVPSDETGVACCVYNSTVSASYWNRYKTADAYDSGNTGDPAVHTYTSLGTGSYPAEAAGYDQAEIIVVAAAHTEAERLEWMAYLAEEYETPLVAA